MFRKFAFIGILSVLAGCETFVGMGRDLDNLMEISGINGDILSIPSEKATKAPEVLPSTINPRTGIVIQSQQDKADAKAEKAAKKSQNSKNNKNKKASSQPLTAEKASSQKMAAHSEKNMKNVKKDSRTTSPIKKNPLCSSAPIDKLETVSQFYHFYYKKPKTCKGQDYHDKAQNIYRLVLAEKDHQDIRLLNADHGFMEFSVSIIRYVPQHILKNGASFLRARGCGLIAKEKCNTIINLN